jgi:type II secretory pathway component PulJ
MPVKGRGYIRDERGATLIEMMVGISMASILMFAMTMLIVVTMHASARDSARVSATQLSRNGLSSIIQQLHSACLSPRVAPVQVGSTGSSLSFVHSSGSEVTAKPVLSVISLSGETLTQYDYASTGSISPPWTFATTPSSTRQLMTGVAPIPPQTAIFSYYSSSNGQISSTPLATPLNAAGAATAILVNVGISSAPTAKKRNSNPGVSTHIQDSVLLRMTVPSFKETVSPPCE